ncbi:ribosomal large subunit pseudouridine synthase D [Verrucomicrobium sp. GAS474]|uniref:RluA family pseudouridine synthase n=1 Tax=Verrucomicrobium sp. GAS474 TaxID=1882831 RepID=UPI00087AAE29|nr:RluA family pseudouridine synthase [Verrucomicrobium sp. GAS474]SDU09715.1 ribosomal large subunit pseudouridine synthase D [Verrucomicrobium sp. GAS474]
MHFSTDHLRPHRDSRVDLFLAAELGRSRSFVQELIEAGRVVLAPNPERLKASYKIRAGDELSVVDEALVAKEPPVVPEGQDIPLSILFEDEAVLVLDKAPGLVVHPAAGHADGTLVNALVHHCGGSLAGRGGDARLGIVHRLDKDTSGLMVVAKTDLAHERLAAQFADRDVHKTYQALCWGQFRRPVGTCLNKMARHRIHRQKMAVVSPNSTAGKEAHTDYRVLLQGKPGAWVECLLHTGRTHQIRVHMTHLGYPIAGDQLYGRGGPKRLWDGEEVPRQMLHAAKLAFTHPMTGKEIEFEAPLPEDFKRLLARIGG